MKPSCFGQKKTKQLISYHWAQTRWESPQTHTGETLPPCVRGESSHSWRLSDSETSAAFMPFVRSDFTQHSYWIIAAESNNFPPFQSDDESHAHHSPAVTQVWVTEYDLPPVSHVTTPLPVPWIFFYNSQEPKPVTADVCQHVPDETRELHCGRDGRADGFLKAEVVLSRVTFNTCAILFWHVRVALLSQSRPSRAQRVTGESTLTQSKHHRRT